MVFRFFFFFFFHMIIGKIEKFVNLRVYSLTNHIALSFFASVCHKDSFQNANWKWTCSKHNFVFPWLILFTATKMTYKVASEILMVFKFGTSPDFFFFIKLHLPKTFFVNLPFPGIMSICCEIYKSVANHANNLSVVVKKGQKGNLFQKPMTQQNKSTIPEKGQKFNIVKLGSEY